ncbi:MAG: hypothetical protein QGH60_20850 [Phycisphaerae bacterium]|nr:hypothetical protein [Phycisphaerae bacterium]
MKNCLLILVVGLMLCVPFGCERGVDEDPVSYERDVDGPPVAIRTPMPDYDIIGNPSAVRRRREALLAAGGDTSTGAESGGGVDLSGPSSPASEDEIAEVKAVIENVLKTKDSGDDSAAMAFFSDEAATAIQEITQGVKDIQAKSLELHSLMEDKFAAQYPDALKAENEKMRTEPAGPSSAAEILGDVSMDQLVFTKVGARVVATGPKNDKIVFSKTEAGWKIEFDKDSREMVGVLSELMTGTTKMLDAIMEGIKDDSITADNVEAKTTELTKQHVAPVQKKLMALMMKAMAGDGDGGAGPADGGAAPADGGAAPADDGAAPADDGAAPADDGAAPADGGAAPADGGAAPADGGAATPPAAGNGL